MTIDQIIRFAKDNKLKSSDLLAASARLEEEELKEMLKSVGGKYFFGEEEDVEEYDEYEEDSHFSEDMPILASKCFGENEDIAITRVILNDNGEIEIGGYSVPNGKRDNYWLSPEDFCEGQVSKITDEIRIYG